MQRIAVTECPGALFGSVEFISPRRINDSGADFPVPCKCYADAAVLPSSGVIGGPVNGIYYPYIFMSDVIQILFFAQETAAWHQGAKALYEEMLYC